MQETVYENRSYLTTVYIPKKNEVVAGALEYLKQFILECNMQNFEDIRLTKRENQVISLLSQGYTPKEIAGHLGIKVTSVRSFINNIYEIYGVNSRVRAVLEYQKGANN